MKKERFGEAGDYGPNSIRMHFQVRVTRRYPEIAEAIRLLDPDLLASLLDEVSEDKVKWVCLPSATMSPDRQIPMPDIPGEYAVTRWVTDAISQAAASTVRFQRSIERREQLFPADPVQRGDAQFALMNRVCGWRPSIPWLLMPPRLRGLRGLDAVYFAEWPRIEVQMCLGRLADTTLYMKYRNWKPASAMWGAETCPAEKEGLFDSLLSAV